jgi:hypothetical protein
MAERQSIPLNQLAHTFGRLIFYILPANIEVEFCRFIVPIYKDGNTEFREIKISVLSVAPR